MGESGYMYEKPYEAKTKPGEKSMQNRNMSDDPVYSQQTIVKDADKITMLICLCFTWSFLLVGLGYGFGENWEAVSSYLKTYGSVVFVLIIGIVGLQLYFGFRSRRRTEIKDKEGGDVAGDPDK